MTAFPDFGKEIERPFTLDERCLDCVELYAGCNARPENPASRCADYFPLPDVGVNGKTGQEIPASRMGDRKQPRVRFKAKRSDSTPVTLDEPHTRKGSRPPKQPRQLSPAAHPGPNGERLCTCGAVLRKRERCCGACRLQRRKETMQRRRTGDQRSTAVGSASDMPFFHAATSAM